MHTVTCRNWGALVAVIFCTLVAAVDSFAAKTASFAEFDSRAKAGERLAVVFFGGSLTWSANATEPNVTGFRGLMARYLAEKYPAAHFSFVDAAIGGTGSNLGMFRLERDVLSKRPDLVFLDFACNDGGENTDIAPTCCYGAARGSGTTDRLTSDRVRGGFVTVDPSVRRLRRPVAG